MVDDPEKYSEPAASEPEEASKYTAFENWRYSQIIHKSAHRQRWRNLTESFLYASLNLVKTIADHEYGNDTEGLAAVFLFRHYLELALKGIIVRGRWLERPDKNARENAERVRNVHDLALLWTWVLRDAKTKLNSDEWGNYDTQFVEKCIAEFDAVDKKGFAFRYAGEDGDFCLFDYRTLARVMDHIRQVLDGIDTCLVEAHAENREYESYLESELGTDY
jgi:hypothetical protein